MTHLTNNEIPLISVVMPTYQEDLTLLKKSIISILKQSFKSFEFIIIVEPDDVNIIFLKNLSLKYPKIRLIVNKDKSGFVKSLNIGIKFSNSDLIVRMDSDDYSDYTRLEKQYSFMVKNPNIDVLGTSIYLVEKNKKQIKKRYYPLLHSQILKRLVFFSPLAHPSTMIRKKCFKDFGLYDEDFLKCEDLELWLRLAKNGCNFNNLQDTLLYYNIENKKILRDKIHWKFNYKARKMHQASIFNKSLTFLSNTFFLFLSSFDFNKKTFVLNIAAKYRDWFKL